MQIGVIGLGYVGLPLALALSKHFSVIGFDVNSARVKELSGGVDRNNETLGEDLKKSKTVFTNSPVDLRKCDFVIIAVPTPINAAKIPDLEPLRSASELIGNNMKKGAIVVFESTVYPGATEEFCVPIIEKLSGLKCGVDWKVGYSPERVNPGDLKHTIEKITKVVSGMDKDSLEKISAVYSKVTNVYLAQSIKVAEAAKVIENTQRDLNIALVNELSLIFRKMGIETQDVLNAAKTKWNFLDFSPGLVGGHCIGVDPYYLTYKAEELGYHPQLILAGRRINDGMALHVVSLIAEGLNKNRKPIKGSRILILGATFKENVKDTRNSKIGEIIFELERLGAKVILNDPLLDEAHFDHFVVKVAPLESVSKVDAVLFAVPHNKYSGLSIEKIKSFMEKPFIVDIKGILPKDESVCRL